MELGKARDLPDDFHLLPNSRSSVIQNLGEVSARLGNPPVMDGRGEVLWFDVCNKGFASVGWSKSGTGADVYLEAANASYGAYSFKLIGGSDNLHNAGLSHSFQVILGERIGYEAQFDIGTEFENISLFMYHSTGDKQILGRFEVSYENQNIICDLPDAGTHVIHEFTTERPLSYGILQLKGVCDFNNREYVRFLLDEFEYNLSGLSIPYIETPCDPENSFTISFVSRLGNNDFCNLQHQIVTINEP